MPVKSASPAVRWRPWHSAALVLGLALFSFWPALQGGLVWDDQAHVTRPDLRSMAGLGRIWTDLHATQQYYPILHSAFWIEHRLWGDATLGYHLANVLWHATAAWLLIALLGRLRIPGALLAGLIFVVHPVCVESVAWISEQKNTLSLVFYLLAALAYVRFDAAGNSGARRSTATYGLATLFFVLALLTKTVTATLPAALLVVFWWQRGRLSWRRDVLPLLPWLAAALISGLFTAWVERTLIGAEGAEFNLTLLQRCLLAGRVIWFYLGKLFWPTQLVFIYPHWDVNSAAASWAGCLVGAFAVTVGFWLLRRRTRGPLAAWLFFVGSLFPALGFFNVYPFIFSYVADHFQYLASLGVIAGVSAGAGLLLARATPGRRIAGAGFCALAIATLAVLSQQQSRTYGDLTTLYSTTIDRNPNCWMAHYNLGLLLSQEGQPDQAIAHFQTAVRIKPDYAEAMVNWGDVLFQRGDIPGAARKYEDALRINPNGVEAHTDLGLLQAKTGRSAEAAANYEEALRLNPDFAPAHFNLGNLLRGAGRIPEAIAQYENAVRLNPDYADAQMNLGGVLLESGRVPEAAAHYEETLRIKPGSAAAHANYGYALRRLGRTAEANAQFALANALSGKP